MEKTQEIKNTRLNDLGKSSAHNISVFGWQFTEVAAFSKKNRVSKLKFVFLFPSRRYVGLRISGKNYEPERSHPTQQIWFPPLRSACGHYLLTPCIRRIGINHDSAVNILKEKADWMNYTDPEEMQSFTAEPFVNIASAILRTRTPIPAQQVQKCMAYVRMSTPGSKRVSGENF
jgi:hypothetical protein